MDEPLQRTIRIGNATVGLLGLNIALSQLSGKEISEDDAVKFLYEQVRRKNYIPEQAIKPYQEALRRECPGAALCHVQQVENYAD
jgi:hypothetical protein